jgi:hypothetical protein
VALYYIIIYYNFNLFKNFLNTCNGNGCAAANGTIAESALGTRLAIHTTTRQELALTAADKALITNTDALSNINKASAHIKATQKHGQNNSSNNN